MTLLEMLRAWWRLGGLKPIGLSIDITDRCPLSCAGCYMKWYKRNEDVPLERWKEIITAFPASERTFCAWTGGEPLLRADDIRSLSRHFRWSWIATNGTLPIPDIPRTTVFVSVDGPKEIHNSLRGGWDEIVKHVRPEHHVACTVRRENCAPGTLRELTEFWKSRARGIVFGFLTPGESDAGVSLDREERARVVATVRALGREFGGFVLGVPGQVTDCARTAWRGRKTCPAAAVLVTFDAGGRRKKPCTLGAEVDCSRCGCAVPAFLRRVRRFDLRTMLDVAGLFRRR
ncbi:MAG: radical SAM protein [Planctomycetota bacterium]|jgi:organic radical activating enzyme